MAIRLPVWNNPYIGLPTLVAATLATYGAAGETALRAAQARIGRASATHLLHDGVVPLNATALEYATFSAQVLRNDGFSGIAVRGDARTAWVEAVTDPYLELYGFLPSPAATDPILWGWNAAMASVVSPTLTMTPESDPIVGGGPLRWRFDLSGTPVANADRRPPIEMGPVTPDQQAWLNPLVRTYAILVALIDGWGAEGQALAVRAYRRLGHEMGVTFMEAGIAPKGATAQQWGHVSDQIADENGLADHELLDDGPERYTTVMPACARYAVPLRFLGAPPRICDVPMNWDNGEMDVVADELIELTVPSCAYRGDARCVYSIGPRPGKEAAAAAHAARVAEQARATGTGRQAATGR